MRNRTKITCARCGSNLNYDGMCSDETCPFSDYGQNNPKGWTGHPEYDEDNYDDSYLYLDDHNVGDH